MRYREASYGRRCRTSSPDIPIPKPGPKTLNQPPAATGIDYLALTAATHHEQRSVPITASATTPCSPPTLPRPGTARFRPAQHRQHRRPRRPEWGLGVSIERLQQYYGFTWMPFWRGLAPAMLHRHPGHSEAVTRISWCVISTPSASSPAKSVLAKPWRSARRPPPWTPPATSSSTCPTLRSGSAACCTTLSGALGRVPSFYTATLARKPPRPLAAEHAGNAANPVVVIDEAHLLDNAKMEAIRMLTNHDMDRIAVRRTARRQPTAASAAPGRAGCTGSAHRDALRHRRDGPPDTADYIAHHTKIAGRTDTVLR